MSGIEELSAKPEGEHSRLEHSENEDEISSIETAGDWLNDFANEATTENITPSHEAENAQIAEIVAKGKDSGTADAAKIEDRTAVRRSLEKDKGKNDIDQRLSETLKAEKEAAAKAPPGKEKEARIGVKEGAGAWPMSAQDDVKKMRVQSVAWNVKGSIL